MSYLVLARKWRPTQLDEVVGQGHVARTLRNAIEQDRVAHAFLFAGARGVGKTSTARILAKALNCKEGPTATPCGECIACTEITAGQALDVFEIDGASNRGINEIRELRESVRYAPSRDKYKIYIIDEVHMLTTEAFNALLKTLEEPPPHAKFVFATTEPQKIPVTILSRCQRYDFKRVGMNDIVGHLEDIASRESIDAEKGALQVIARQAAGGMRDALSLLDQIISFSEGRITEEAVSEVLGVANRRQLFALSEAVIAQQADAALQVLDEVNRYGYDLGAFATELVHHFRDLTVINVVAEPSAVTSLTESEVETARAQIADTPINLLHRYFAVMAEATQELMRSSFPKLIFEMTLVRLAQLEPLIAVDLLVQRLQALEGSLDGPAGPRASTTAPEGTRAKTTGPRGPENPEFAQPAPRREVQPPSAPVRPPSTERSSKPTPPVTTKSAEPEPEPESEPEPARDLEPEVRPIERPVERVVETAEIDRLTPQARWKRVVELVGLENRALAATAEHAWVERFEGGKVEVSFPTTLADLVDAERIEALQAALRTLLGPRWTLHVSTASKPQTSRTLAQERDDEIARRVQMIEDELRNHQVVREARDLFEVEANQVRVQVKLFDDE